MSETATAPAAPSLLDSTAKPVGDGQDTSVNDTSVKDTSLLDTPAKPTPDGKTENTPDSSKTTPAPDTTDTSKTAPVAPEKYADFKAPEGIALDTELISKFDAECKALGLPQEKRDAFLAMQTELTQKEISKTMDHFQKQISDWTEETKKELGSDADKSLAVARKAIDTIFTDPKERSEFLDMMKTTGLGNWRLMVKAFSFVGKSLSEDKLTEGRPGSERPKTFAEVIFDHPDSKAAMGLQ